MRKWGSCLPVGVIVSATILLLTCQPPANNPPNTPATPSGPTTGQVGVSYDFTSSSTDPDKDGVAIRFDWGNGVVSNWSSFVTSGQQVTMSYSYQTAGTYNVKAQAMDDDGDTSDWSAAHQITISAGSSNNPPNTPATPSGPATGEVGVSYDFTSSSTDPDGDSVAIRFDWGDGNISNWSSYAASGATITASHSFSSVGTYNVKAQAKDVHGDTSAWSGGHQITISSGGYPNQVVATVAVDPSPEGLAALPNGEYVYVANYNSDNVSVIRTSDNTVVATVPVGGGPRGLAALPNSEYVYVAGNNLARVSVIRTSDNTVVATVAVGTRPLGVAALPNGRYVYVATRDDDAVSIIRTSDNTVVETVTVGDQPVDVAVLPDGDFVYVSNYGTNDVTVIGR